MSESPPLSTQQSNEAQHPPQNDLLSQAGHQVSKETLNSNHGKIVPERDNRGKIPSKEGVFFSTSPKTDGVVFGVDVEDSSLFALRFASKEKGGKLMPTVVQFDKTGDPPLFSTKQMTTILEMSPQRYPKIKDILPDDIPAGVKDNINGAWSFYILGPDDSGCYRTFCPKNQQELETIPSSQRTSSMTIVRYQDTVTNTDSFMAFGKNLGSDKKMKMAECPDMMESIKARHEKLKTPEVTPSSPAAITIPIKEGPARDVLESLSPSQSTAPAMPEVPQPVAEQTEKFVVESITRQEQLTIQPDQKRVVLKNQGLIKSEGYLTLVENNGTVESTSHAFTVIESSLNPPSKEHSIINQDYACLYCPNTLDGYNSLEGNSSAHLGNDLLTNKDRPQPDIFLTYFSNKSDASLFLETGKYVIGLPLKQSPGNPILFINTENDAVDLYESNDKDYRKSRHQPIEDVCFPISPLPSVDQVKSSTDLPPGFRKIEKDGRTFVVAEVEKTGKGKGLLGTSLLAKPTLEQAIAVFELKTITLDGKPQEKLIFIDGRKATDEQALIERLRVKTGITDFSLQPTVKEKTYVDEMKNKVRLPTEESLHAPREIGKAEPAPPLPQPEATPLQDNKSPTSSEFQISEASAEDIKKGSELLNSLDPQLKILGINPEDIKVRQVDGKPALVLEKVSDLKIDKKDKEDALQSLNKEISRPENSNFGIVVIDTMNLDLPDNFRITNLTPFSIKSLNIKGAKEFFPLLKLGNAVKNLTIKQGHVEVSTNLNTEIDSITLESGVILNLFRPFVADRLIQTNTPIFMNENSSLEIDREKMEGKGLNKLMEAAGNYYLVSLEPSTSPETPSPTPAQPEQLPSSPSQTLTPPTQEVQQTETVVKPLAQPETPPPPSSLSEHKVTEASAQVIKEGNKLLDNLATRLEALDLKRENIDIQVIDGKPSFILKEFNLKMDTDDKRSAIKILNDWTLGANFKIVVDKMEIDASLPWNIAELSSFTIQSLNVEVANEKTLYLGFNKVKNLTIAENSYVINIGSINEEIDSILLKPAAKLELSSLKLDDLIEKGVQIDFGDKSSLMIKLLSSTEYQSLTGNGLYTIKKEGENKYSLVPVEPRPETPSTVVHQAGVSVKIDSGITAKMTSEGKLVLVSPYGMEETLYKDKTPNEAIAEIRQTLKIHESTNDLPEGVINTFQEEIKALSRLDVEIKGNKLLDDIAGQLDILGMKREDITIDSIDDKPSLVLKKADLKITGYGLELNLHELNSVIEQAKFNIVIDEMDLEISGGDDRNPADLTQFSIGSLNINGGEYSRKFPNLWSYVCLGPRVDNLTIKDNIRLTNTLLNNVEIGSIALQSDTLLAIFDVLADKLIETETKIRFNENSKLLIEKERYTGKGLSTLKKDTKGKYFLVPVEPSTPPPPPSFLSGHEVTQPSAEVTAKGTELLSTIAPYLKALDLRQEDIKILAIGGKLTFVLEDVNLNLKEQDKKDALDKLNKEVRGEDIDIVVNNMNINIAWGGYTKYDLSQFSTNSLNVINADLNSSADLLLNSRTKNIIIGEKSKVNIAINNFDLNPTTISSITLESGASLDMRQILAKNKFVNSKISLRMGPYSTIIGNQTMKTIKGSRICTGTIDFKKQAENSTENSVTFNLTAI